MYVYIGNVLEELLVGVLGVLLMTGVVDEATSVGGVDEATELGAVVGVEDAVVGGGVPLFCAVVG